MIHGPARRGSRAIRAPRSLLMARFALCLAIPIAAASCVYYNTFFMAKKSFNAAEASVARSQSDRVPVDATNNYEVTIAQCRKVLLRHPKSRWADDAVYLMGASYYGKGDYDSALIRLNQFVQMYPKSKRRPDALFLSGMAQIKRHNYGEGQTAFDQVLREYPRFPRRDEIYFAVAEGAASRRDTPAAIRGYESIVRDLPKSRRMEDALRRIGEIYFDSGKLDSASIAFGRMLTLSRDSHKRAEAAVLQARTLIRLERPEEALKLVRESIPRDDQAVGGTGIDRPPDQSYDANNQVNYRNPDDYQVPTSQPSDDIPRLRLQEAAALNKMGRPGEALETLRAILSRYGTSSYAIEAQFQIGYTYETILDSLEAARAAYEKVAQLPGRSVFRDQASQRAQAVRSFITLQKQAQTEDAAEESRAAAALRIAESLLLDRGLAKEAAEQYRKLESDFPKSRAAARAGYALAYIRWKEEKDSLGAQQEFRELVARYPDSPQARGAIKLLVSQGADTAGLNGLLRAIVPDSIQVARPDSGSTSAGDSTRVVGLDRTSPQSPDSTLERMRDDSLAAPAAAVRGEGMAPPGLRDSMRNARRFPVEHPLDRIPPPPLPPDSSAKEEPKIP